jgi:hypothetical protein
MSMAQDRMQPRLTFSSPTRSEAGQQPEDDTSKPPEQTTSSYTQHQERDCLALLVAFVLLGLPAWVPVIATIVGVIGGGFLTMALGAGSWSALDRLAYRVAWVDRHGGRIWDLFFVVALALSPVIAVVATVALLWVAA